jgi:hypothetical protein
MRVGDLVKCENRLALIIIERIHRGSWKTYKIQFVDNGKTTWSNNMGLEVVCE